MQNTSFHVDCGCVTSPKMPGGLRWTVGQREVTEWVSPSHSSPARAWCGQRVLQRTLAGGLFLCRGSAGSPSRGGEHPPRGRNFLHRDIFSETQSEWKGEGGRRQISIGRSCALPRAFVPRAMRSQGTPSLVRGQWGHPWDLPPSWEGGRSAGGCLHPSPLPGCRAVMLLTPRDAACGPAGDVPFCILK